MSPTYLEPDHLPRGKTTDHSDVFRARLLELISDERIVQLIEFESKDPALAAPMMIKWTLADVTGGTEVTVHCENAPDGIRTDNHTVGFRSTLQNLAAFTE